MANLHAHGVIDDATATRFVKPDVAEQMAEALKPFTGMFLPSMDASTIRVQEDYLGRRVAMNDYDRAVDKARATLEAFNASKADSSPRLLPGDIIVRLNTENVLEVWQDGITTLGVNIGEMLEQVLSLVLPKKPFPSYRPGGLYAMRTPEEWAADAERRRLRREANAEGEPS